MNKVRTIFIGSGEFAITQFKELLKLDYINLVAVITQPDRPIGRKQELAPTPLKDYILKNSIKIALEQPEKIRLVSQDLLSKYQPELIIVAAYGQIIPQDMLEYPKHKCLNLHGSILPKLRGAVPVNMTILEGFTETGVTLQRMEMEMDKGPIVSVKKYKLKKDETAESLMSELSELSGEIIKEDLIKWIRGEILEVEQNESEATYCYKEDISKEKAEIKFDTPVEVAERMVRAFYPWPVAWVSLESKMFKIYKASDIRRQVSEIDKLALKVMDKKLYLVLKDGLLGLEEVQLEGKKRDLAKNYLYLVH